MNHPSFPPQQKKLLPRRFFASPPGGERPRMFRKNFLN